MKKIGLKITVILIAIILLVQMTGITSIASDLSDVNKKIEQKEEEIDGIQEEKSDAMKEVATLTAQITDYQNQIDDLDAKIDELNTKINDAQKKVDEAQAEYDNNKALAEERLVVMQESGDTTYLDMLLTSSSITDFISNYYLASELAEADTELLDSIEKERQEIENAKAELESNKKELDNSKTSKQAASSKLSVLREEKNTQVAQLTEDEKAIQKQIDEITEANKEIDQQIKQAEAQINNNGGGSGAPAGAPSGSANLGNVSSSGFIYPVPSSYQKITTGLYYSSGAYHGAVDFGSGGINGQPIFAVAAGTVIISTRLNGSYGNYIIIKHDNGLYTLYAHGQDGSRTVSTGDRVSQGQQIMRVGSTGNSTGPHLHFEVRTSPGGYSNRVEPRRYLP